MRGWKLLGILAVVAVAGVVVLIKVGLGTPMDLEARFRTPEENRGRALTTTFRDYSLETVDLELKDVVTKLEDAFEARDSAAFCKILTDDFRGSCFEGLVPIEGDGITRASAKSLDDWTDGKDALRKALDDYFALFDSIYESHLKVSEYLEGQAFTNRVNAKMKQDIRGRRADGGVQQEHVKWKVSFAKVDGNWRLDRAFVVSREQLAARAPMFTEVTTAAGLMVTEPPDLTINGLGNLNLATHRSQYDYGGLCVYDVDGDGWYDVFMPNAYGPSLLYMNHRDGTFVEEAHERGVVTPGRSRGAVFGDIDNDGDPDLFVAAGPFHHPRVPVTGNLFFINTGDGRFREATEAAGLGYQGASMTATFLDYDRDGYLDLFVGNYAGPEAYRTKQHHPFDAKHGEPDLLYHNNGDGTFTDVSKASGIGRDTRLAYAAAVCDWNEDGYPDIYVANDFGPNHFYINQGNGTFEDRAKEYGIEDYGNGMGATFTDYNNDGRWDLYVTNMQSGTGQRVLRAGVRQTSGDDFKILWKLTLGNSFFVGAPGGKFTKSRAIDAGIANCGWAWNADFADFDGDGDQDLYVLNGYYSGETARDC